MLIAIPSKGRCDKVKSQQLIPSAHVFVPVAEKDAYEKCGVKNVVGVPDNIKGITATRNFILRFAHIITERRDSEIVFIDDDVKSAGWCELFETSTIHRKLKEKEWLAEFGKLFDVMRGVKLRAWGLATVSATRAVYPWKPFIFHSYITASCMGMVADGKTFFDESFPVKEDYELCLRLLKEDGAILGARYLYWENAHWTGDGGCKSYRTQKMEEDAIKKLQSMYPGMIRRVTRGGSQYSIELEF
jgi:hypothetical protein